MEKYCHDETDPIEQAKGPDFVTESWIVFRYLDIYVDSFQISIYRTKCCYQTDRMPG